MSNQKTIALLRVPTKVIDSGYESFEDGKFEFLSDLPKFIDDFMVVMPGVNAAKDFKQENIEMSIEDANGVQFELIKDMPNVPAKDANDIGLFMSGVTAGLRLFWRKGYEKGRDDLAQELKAGTVSIDEL